MHNPSEALVDKLGRDINKIDMDSLSERIDNDDKVFRRASNQFAILASKATPVLEQALPLESNLNILSLQMRRTLHKLDDFADNPKLSKEWRQLVDELKETAQIAQQTITDLNKIVSDKSLKKDIARTMDDLNQTTAQFEHSINMLQQVSSDKALRSDVKEIMVDLRQALDSLDRILRNPDSGSDVRETLKSTRSTLSDIDIAAKQLQQILDKRHPIIHMFLGRPGHLKIEQIAPVEVIEPTNDELYAAPTSSVEWVHDPSLELLL